MSSGRHQQAAALLEPLQTAFADDAQISEAYTLCRQILDRATKLMQSGLRGLQAQHTPDRAGERDPLARISKIRRASCPTWRPRSAKRSLRPTRRSPRRPRSSAPATSRGARQMAMAVLANIADHDGAIELARSAGTMNERIARA